MRFNKLHPGKKLRQGISSAESRTRWNNYLHLLREVVHLHSAWIPRADSIDVKVILGIHVYEDALFVGRIRARLEEFGMGDTQVLQPCEKIRRILEMLNSYETWEEYIGAVYNVLKPFLIDAWETHFTTTDPLLDEPSTRLLADLLRITSQHINGGMVLIESLLMEDPEQGHRLHVATERLRDLLTQLGPDTTQLPNESKPNWAFAVKNSLHLPAREQFVVQAVPSADTVSVAQRLHNHLNLRLQAAELLAITMHENPRAPWFVHETVSRQVWDLVRHARILESLLESMEAEWGHYPITLQLFGELYELPPQERFARLSVERARAAQELAALLKELSLTDGQNPALGAAVDYLRADDEWHHSRRVHWAW